MNFASLTDVGRSRELNEDSIHADGRIFIVADGMGGHKAGEIASNLAIKEFLKNMEGGSEGGDLREKIVGSIQQANLAIYRKAKSDRSMEGMGTTFTAAVLQGETACIGHVGDSRAYLFRRERLIQLTEDHSLVAELVRQGKLDPQEAFGHPQRNIITRALGTQKKVEVHYLEQRLEEGDLLLLCSDGLTTHLQDEDIAGILSENEDLEVACKRLVDEANKKGGSDNISIVLVKYPGTPIHPAKTPPATPALISPHTERRTRISPAPKPRGRLVVLVTALVIALLLLSGFFFFLYLKNNYYYVGESPHGEITLYRGLPWKFLGIRLHSTVMESSQQVEDLPDDKVDNLRHPALRNYEAALQEYEALCSLAKEYTRVPDLVGLTVEEARDAAERSEINLEVIPSDVPGEAVINRQEPKGGTLLRAQDYVRVWAGK